MIPVRHRTRRARRSTIVAAALALTCSALATAIATAVPATAGTAAAGTAAAGVAAACPWVHSSAPIATRVSEVLSQMTLDDKIAMVDGVGFSTGTAGYVGHVAANPRLCVPGLNLEDGPQGVADNVPGVTQLPAPVALAAAWDPGLARAYGSVAGSEERGKGADVNLGPTVNIVRDPRWGRAFEAYGEDPYLAGQTAVGFINGVQAQGVMSQVKHVAVYNQETSRNTAADNAVVSQRTMQEIYLPQFEAAVTQGKAASVMCSYSTVNGQYACQNSYLLKNVLKQQWRFPGFVTSDWGATHSTVPSALNGLDMQMPGGSGFGTDYYGAPLKQSLAQVPASTPAQWPGTSGTVQYSEGVLVGYRWYATRHITPLFPFGAGLSYTTFAFSHLAVRPGREGSLVVSADVTDTGSRAGADVAQLYVGDPASTGEPAEQLKGFQRVTLRPGQTRVVTFTVDRSAFAWWNEQTSRWTVTPGTYALMVGDSSASLPLLAHVPVP